MQMNHYIFSRSQMNIFQFTREFFFPPFYAHALHLFSFHIKNLDIISKHRKEIFTLNSIFLDQLLCYGLDQQESFLFFYHMNNFNSSDFTRFAVKLPCRKICFVLQSMKMKNVKKINFNRRGMNRKSFTLPIIRPIPFH